MLSLHHCGMVPLFLIILKGVSCQELNPVKTEESSSEGSSVTLSYNYSKDPTGSDFFFWYRQYPGKPPEFIISHSGTGSGANGKIDGMEIKVEQKQIQMNISSAAVSDSAVYYCAVRPALGGDKILFGKATRLNVQTSADYEPLYYELESNETKACLATGFSKHDAAKNKSAFRNEEAARPSKKSWDGSLEDALYSSVALISKSAEKCEEGGRPTKPCGDFLEKDPTVNAVSLTILGLRLLFIKTIVFNVLITLRFWMSQ